MTKTPCKLMISIMIVLSCILSTLTFANSEIDIEKKLNKQIAVNPEQVFYEIEALLIQPNISLKHQAKLMVMQSEIAYYIDQPEYILKYSTQALSTGLLDDAWHSRVLVSQARGYFQRGQYKKYLAVANMAIQKAEKSDLAFDKVAALVERAYANVLLDNTEKAKQDLTLSAKYLNVVPNMFDKAIVLERFSAANRTLNFTDIAIKSQKQSIDIFKNINSLPFLSISYYNLGRIHQKLEHWEKASELMLQSYRWALKDKNKLNQAFSLSRLSEYQTKLGKTEQAKKYLDEAVVAADASTSERVKITVRTNMADFLCHNNELKACEELLSETLSFAKSYQMKLDEKILIAKLAEAYYLQGFFEKAYLTLKNNEKD